MSEPCKIRFTTWINQKAGGAVLGEVVVAEEHDTALSQLAALREQLNLTEESNAGLSSTISADVIAYKKLCDDLAALREELSIVNREKNDVAYRANETAEKLNSMAISKATMRNQLKQKLASTQQRLADAERRNSELLQLAEIAKEWDGSWLPSDFHRRLEALTKIEKVKS